jgi:hypothetical protein
MNAQLRAPLTAFAARRERACIVQQMDYHLNDPFKIHSHWRETLRNVDFKRMAKECLP